MSAARPGSSAVEPPPVLAEEPIVPTAGQGPAARAGWTGAGLFLLAQVVLLACIRWWQPRFFYIDDKLAQYLPVWHWLGAQPGVRVPVIDPDQGSGGNFVGDLQYGVLDPFHWLLAAAISHLDGMNAAGWGLHVLAVTVLGLGVVVLAHHYGAGPVWAAAAAVGAANSGYLLWFAASWWPAAWGTAVLPWLWWGLVTRSRWGVPVTVLAAYLVGTSGYPYSLPFAGVIVVGVAVERVLRHRALHALRGAGFPHRLVAAAGGLLLAAPGLLAASAMTPYTQRASLDHGVLGSTGDFIPNLLDVLVGGPTSNAQVSGWWGAVLPAAAMATGWFVLPVVALVNWARFRELGGVRAFPGMVVSVLLIGAALLATQTPTVVAGLRYPFRYVVIVQVVLPLLVAVLASRTGLRLTRRRLLFASGLVIVQGLLGVFRTPELVAWHVGAAVVGGLVLLAVRWSTGGGDVPGRDADEPVDLHHGGPDRPATSRGYGAVARSGRMVAAALLVATTVAPLVSIGAAVAVNDRFAEARGAVPSGLPADGLFNGNAWPASVGGFRDRAVEPGLNATVLVWGDAGGDRGLAGGVPVGSAALFSDMRTSFGYTSVGQAGWSDRWCQDFLGQSATCGDAVARLLTTVPGTDRTWLDVTSKDVLLIDDRSPVEIEESLAGRWRQVGRQGAFMRYERIDPSAGRITVAGDAVTDLVANSVATDSESYTVSWSVGGDHRLITRIPWWPGYQATLDGQPLPVQRVDRTVVAVDLPEGSGRGDLRIFFEPPGRALGRGAAVLGAVLLLAAGLLELRRSRSRSRG